MFLGIYTCFDMTDDGAVDDNGPNVKHVLRVKGQRQSLLKQTTADKIGAEIQRRRSYDNAAVTDVPDKVLRDWKNGKLK